MRRAETERVWSRLEPRAQDQEMKDALEAPVRDPLWMLSRQWQVSEFEGEDAGSPIRADLSMAEDPLSQVDLRGGGPGVGADEQNESDDLAELLGNGPGDPFPYDGKPLEAIVEREQVMTDDDPPTRQRVEAGQQFLRILSEEGYADLSPKDFPAELRLDEPDEALESPDRRYVDLMADRALDGTEVARAIQSAVGDIDSLVASSSDSDVTPGELPLPSDRSRNSTFDGCVETYYNWYVNLYEEPTERTGTAWDPTRLEYRFAVATGDTETESVLEAEEYHGGRLDWYNFSAVDETLQTATSDETRKWSKTVLPSQITFPGMPASRWWELEDTDVDLSKMIAEGAPLTRLMLTEFATVYGNDWFRIPVESPVGTLTRVTDLTVTDSFGVTTEATSATDDEWHMFMHDLPNHDEPGLFVPPTLGTSWTGDPVEKVTFARDELANLVFAIERIYEGPTGRAVDRTEFDRPALYVENVFENDNPDDEYLVLQNTGEDGLDIDGYVVEANTGGTQTTLHKFGRFTLGPDETVSIYTGQAKPDEEGAIGAEEPDAVLEPADSVSVRNDDGRLVRRKLLTGPSDALADYRLSTDVPDYWFPFTVERGREYRLKQSLLLDADSLGLPIEEIPRPLGEILNPPDEHLPAGEEVYQLFDEEVTRSGQTVTRQYQFARWLDGSSYLWSTRESRLGDTQLDSGLRFDILDERE